MNLTDILGSLGVALILIAYFINIADYISNDHPLYICMNIVGATLACLASIRLEYIPFIVIESVWVVVSMWALIIFFKRDYKNFKNGNSYGKGKN
jgi:hypothetical protein